MITGLAGATIWSEDVNNLLPFYRDLIGLKVGIQIPGFVVLGELGTPVLALGTHSQVRGRNADPARHMVGLLTDDVDGDWKRLKSAGVEFVGVYEGEGIPEGKRSITLRFEYRADRTLRDEEVDEMHWPVVEALKRQFNAEVR